MRLPPIITISCALLAPALGGCSFLFSEGAPDDHASRVYFACAESYAPPIVDTVVAAVAGLAVVSTAQSGLMHGETESQRQAALAIDGAVAALTTAAAAYGYVAVSGCREAKRERAFEMARASALPPPYGVPPWGQAPPVWPPPLRAAPRTAIPAPAPPPPAEPEVVVPPPAPERLRVTP
jgi:hypothetical protein